MMQDDGGRRMITINDVCAVCDNSEESFGYYRCVAKTRVEITSPSHQTCKQHRYKKIILNAEHKPLQDPTTKCTDPADKDAVIRDLRTKLNDKQGVIDSIRADAEDAHRDVQGALSHRNSERLKKAKRALENIIESMGVQP